MSLETDDKRTRTRSKAGRVSSEIVGQELSALSCPLARKRRLQEAEPEQPASKRKSHPLMLGMDEGFNAESEGSGEETELREEEEEGEEQAKQKSGDQVHEEEEQAKQNTESTNAEEEDGDEELRLFRRRMSLRPHQMGDFSDAHSSPQQQALVKRARKSYR